MNQQDKIQAGINLVLVALSQDAQMRTDPGLQQLRQPVGQIARLLVSHHVLSRDGEKGWTVNAENIQTLTNQDKDVLLEGIAQAGRVGAPKAHRGLHDAAMDCAPGLQTEAWIVRDMLQSNPTILYVFGDNMIRKGMGGQAAEMRGEPNAVGIPTKKLPSMEPNAFFSNMDAQQAAAAMAPDWQRLEGHLRAGKTVVWPEAGIGTDRARLAEKAPEIAAYIEQWRQHLDRVGQGRDSQTPQAIGAQDSPRHVDQGSGMASFYAGIGSRETPLDVQQTMTETARLLKQEGWRLRSGGASGADEAFERGVLVQTSPRRVDATQDQIFLGWDGFCTDPKNRDPNAKKYAQQGYIVPNLPKPMVRLYQDGVASSWDRAVTKFLSDQHLPTTTGAQLTSFDEAVTAIVKQGGEKALGQGMTNPDARTHLVKTLNLIGQYHSAPDRLGEGGIALMARNGYQILGQSLDQPVKKVVCWTKGGRGEGGTGQAIRLAKDRGISVLDLGDPRHAALTPKQIVDIVKDPAWRASEGMDAKSASPRRRGRDLSLEL